MAAKKKAASKSQKSLKGAKKIGSAKLMYTVKL